MFTTKSVITCISVVVLLIILFIYEFASTGNFLTVDNWSQKLALSKKPKSYRCHNNQQHMNDWNYLLKNVLHSDGIYHNVDTTDYVPDLQTWTDVGPTFEKFLTEYLSKTTIPEMDREPIRIIEVGSWKGSSALTMANICRRLAAPRKCTILSIDTWLGAPIVYTDPKAIIHTELEASSGNLKLFDKFLKNMILRNVSDIVTPFRLPSLGAAHVLNCFGIKADMIYIDGDHEYEGIKADLAAYYPIVKKNGLFFGDDAENVNVRRAVREMVSDMGEKLKLIDYRADKATWLIWNNF